MTCCRSVTHLRHKLACKYAFRLFVCTGLKMYSWLSSNLVCRAFALEGRGIWHALSASITQQILGPVRARADFRYALDLPSSIPQVSSFGIWSFLLCTSAYLFLCCRSFTQSDACQDEVLARYTQVQPSMIHCSNTLPLVLVCMLLPSHVIHNAGNMLSCWHPGQRLACFASVSQPMCLCLVIRVQAASAAGTTSWRLLARQGQHC